MQYHCLTIVFAALQIRKDAAVTIQTAFRGYSAFTEYLVQCSGFIVIQAEMRESLARKAYHKMKIERDYLVANFMMDISHIILGAIVMRRWMAENWQSVSR